MILVDSSVWIDFFRGTPSVEADKLHALLVRPDLILGDLVLTEVLQGYPREQDFEAARSLMMRVPVIPIADAQVAVAAASNFLALRARGITVRKTIDCLIATRCIMDGHQLLHRDRDFDGFEAHLGLQVVR